MSLYQCDKCGCVENTALGFFHSRHSDAFIDYQEGTRRGMKLCSECGPLAFNDGSKTKFGKWHGKFKKKIFQLKSLCTDKNGNVTYRDGGKRVLLS